MWFIILLIGAVVAYFSLAGQVQQAAPELAKFFPTPSTTAASASASPFNWVGHETAERDGSHSLQLAVADSKQSGQGTSLYVGCYKTEAFAYIYPVVAYRLAEVKLNGASVKYKVDGEPGRERIAITQPLPEALIKELPDIRRLEAELDYAQPGQGGQKQALRLDFQTAGFGIYMPYFKRDCHEAVPDADVAK